MGIDTDYTRGYREGYRDGYNDGKNKSIQQPTLPNTPGEPFYGQDITCQVCSMVFKAVVPIGYYCSNNTCPIFMKATY